MNRRGGMLAVPVLLLILAGGCERWFGPEKSGEIQLSSQLFGSESYYLFGFGYEQAEYYRYPYQGEPVPDIINEAYRMIEGGEVKVLPGFNIPAQVNGFALVGEFTTLAEARSFYDDYKAVEQGLQFETVSDTVELFQVWIQQTSLGNYVKLLVKDINTLQGESGDLYSEVVMDYVYQSDGTPEFPD
ncbi:MAG TPA: hypothetical protein ENO05_04300 [Bacteroides sp.]|nr:hypothetical protein [Bacteroides sp.]